MNLPPSKEAIEAERMARDARARTKANDDLVILIYRVCGVAAIVIGAALLFVQAKHGHRIYGARLFWRSICLWLGGGGSLFRGGMLAKRQAMQPPAIVSSDEMIARYQHQPFVPKPPAPPGEAPPVTRWTD